MRSFDTPRINVYANNFGGTELMGCNQEKATATADIEKTLPREISFLQ
jgi:hypothetical protein